MNSDEMIDRYFDGDMSEVEQEVFFSRLATDSQMRTEFEMGSKIRMNLRTQLENPPAQLRQTILQAIGQVSPTPVVSTAPARSALIRTGILSAIASSILTSALFLSSSFNASSLQESQAQLALSQNTAHTQVRHEESMRNKSTADVEAGSNTHVPSFNSTASKALAISRNVTKQQPNGAVSKRLEQSYTSSLQSAEDNQRMNSKTLQDQQAISAQDKNDLHELFASIADFRQGSGSVYRAASLELPRTTQSLDTQEVHTSTKSAIASSSASVTSTPSIQSVDPLATGPAVSALTMQTSPTLNRFEIRTFMARSFPNVDLPGLISPPVNNLSLSYSRQLGDAHGIGIELGQETLLQRYTNTTTTSTEYISQNFLALWLAVHYQYTFISLQEELGVEPFAQVTTGWSLLGPMGRVALGCRKYFSGAFGLTLALEGSSFAYKQNSSYFSTQKVGLSAGLIFGF